MYFDIKHDDCVLYNTLTYNCKSDNDRRSCNENMSK